MSKHQIILLFMKQKLYQYFLDSDLELIMVDIDWDLKRRFSSYFFEGTNQYIFNTIR